MKTRMVAVLLCALACLATASRREAKPKADKPPEYLLRYKFHVGDTLRWKVVHRCQIHTSVSGTAQAADTTTGSVKVWRSTRSRPMARSSSIIWSNRSTCGTVSPAATKSATTASPIRSPPRVSRTSPRGGRAAGPGDDQRARQTLAAEAELRQGGRGRARRDHDPTARAACRGGPPLDEPKQSRRAAFRRHDAAFKTVQTFKLEDVKTGVATISVSTQFMTPIQDPALEAQLVQYETSGSVRFDIDAGQILARQVDVDKSVVGFRGEASSIHYIGRSTEAFTSCANTRWHRGG